MKNINNTINSKIKIFFKSHSFFSNVIKKIRFTNSFYYSIKREIIKKVLLKFPPYGMETHDSFVTSFWDPVRFAAISLALNNIKNENIEGNLAEFGVFRGISSKIIHFLAPERKLYLFDTFEGFPIEFLQDKNLINSFKETSIKLVKKNIGDMKNVIIRKGVFPETARDLESEKFSFVSLDVDLYLSTLKGLEFFYPKLSKGGFIFIHDYNTPEYNRGGYRAVKEFLKDKPENIIEIPDINGTAIIRKHN